MILAAESHKFPKASRILKRSDFLSLKEEAFFDRNFVFAYRRTGSGRLGVTLSRRVLKDAIARNRVKRLIRETFRLHREQFAGLDVNVIGRSKLADVWPTMGLKDMEALFGKFSNVVRQRSK